MAGKTYEELERDAERWAQMIYRRAFRRGFVFGTIASIILITLGASILNAIQLLTR